MGKKYIIELEENEHLYKTEMVLGEPVLCSVVPAPYPEPDLEREQVRREAYENGFNDGYKAGREAEKVRQLDLRLIKQKAHDNGYSEGYQDGWCKGMNDYLQKPEVKEESDRAYAHGYSDAESKFSEIRKEAYEKGYHAGYAKYLNKSYEDGLNDAWEAARKIDKMTATEFHNCFLEGYDMGILYKYTAAEAIEKLKQYEQKQKEELGIQGYFKKGEEIIDANGTKAVILHVSEDNYCQVYTENAGCIENWHIHTYKFHKTGRYFPEIVTILEKMRGE